MASVADWSTTPASNTTVGGISTDGAITLVKQLDNMIRGLMAEVATSRDDGTINATGERGYIHGLTLSNNGSDITNDIDIAAGECVTSDSPYWRMTLASGLTKRLDAAWAVGTNQGGRMSAAAITDTTYHVWLIQRSDTGVVDVGFDVSATSPTMPASYDRKRRIGSIQRETGAIVLFDQNGDTFIRRVNFTVKSSTAAAAVSLRGFGVPLGIVCQPIIGIVYTAGASVTSGILLGSASAGDVTQQVASINSGLSGQAGTTQQPPPIYSTNTSAQLYFQQVNSVGTPATSTTVTAGWVDARGRIA